MTDSRWIKGATGLWHSVDAVIQKQRIRQQAREFKQHLKAVRRERLAGIRARFEVVMVRNGWARNKWNKWVRA